jgi:hypothetical protein
MDILDLRMRQRSTAQPQPRLHERYDRTAMDMSATDVLLSPQLPWQGAVDFDIPAILLYSIRTGSGKG